VISLLARTPARGDFVASTCPLCRDDIRSQELRSGTCGHCPACETRYHRECFAEFGGCATLGCTAYRQPMARPRAHLEAQVASESCASCREGASRGHLWACPACQTAIHVDCFARRGCAAEGCTNQGAPSALLERAREGAQPFANGVNLFLLLLVPLACVAFGLPLVVALASFILGALEVAGKSERA